MKRHTDSGLSKISKRRQSSNMLSSHSLMRASSQEEYSSTRLVRSPQRRTSESSHGSSQTHRLRPSLLSISDSQIGHGGLLVYHHLVRRLILHLSLLQSVSSRVMRPKVSTLQKYKKLYNKTRNNQPIEMVAQLGTSTSTLFLL